MYKISCFADEISPKLEEQIAVMKQMKIHWLSLRSVENVNVLELTDAQIDGIAEELKKHGIGVSSIGSPIGKSLISDTSNHYLEQTKRAIEIAKRLECRYIRVFSFYMNKEEMPQYRDEVIRRLKEMAQLAADADKVLLLENEAGIYGEQSIHCQELLREVGMSSLRAAFDPSNFVAAGEVPYDESMQNMKDYVAYIHIKDSRRSDGVIVPAGEGDGQIPKILPMFEKEDLFLTLEPHLEMAGVMYGFTGPDLFKKAYLALTELLKAAELEYT